MFNLPGKCLTTAMGILPHTELEEAMQLALSVDIPFWPQLPRFSYYEDMYVQISENFPGIRIDEQNQRIHLNTAAFYAELEEYVYKMDHEETFVHSPKFSVALDSFLRQDLSGYRLIRGQTIGPISFGMRIADENRRPIIYNDDVKEVLYDFIARKVNTQYRQLKAIHPNPFVWVDEPGLEIIFSSFTGYTSDRAKVDFKRFLAGLEGPKGVHLCGNPDWSFLLTGINLDILSVDAYGHGEIFTMYTGELRDFMERGGIISWGVVPTLTEELTAEGVDSLVSKVEGWWDYLVDNGIDRELILSRAWLAPARCCLVNTDGHATVARAFRTLELVSQQIKTKHNLL